jgi:hypothetical protein
MRQVRKFPIDLSQTTGYIEGEEDEIVQGELTRQGLFSPQFLYTVLDGDRLVELQTTGTYGKPGGKTHRNEHGIFAFNHKNLIWDAGASPDCIKTYQTGYPNPAMAIWKRDHFVDYHYFASGEEYVFKDPKNKPKALEAIALLRMPAME